MKIFRKCFKTWDELSEHLASHCPSIYLSSQTSTVIPFEKIESFISKVFNQDIYLCDLSQLPSEYELLENGNLRVRGPLSWQDANAFVRSKGRSIKTSPTESLALVTAGLATSATGERCFGYGNLRSQVVRLKYFDYMGVEQELSSEKAFTLKDDVFNNYSDDFQHYTDFKNAPFPRLQQEIDLMIGTEGQLGVISEVELETAELFPVTYLFTLLPKWEKDFNAHYEIYEKVQNYRSDILSCELVDSNCWSYLDEDNRLGSDNDVLFFEIRADQFEKVYEQIFTNLELTSVDDFFEISEERFHQIRAAVPRAIFEANAKMGVVKHGTDVQVSGDYFKDLMDYYRTGKQLGIKYNLFGHFGDAHLHYNLMPKPDETQKCKDYLEQLYVKVKEWGGSPFAEHGIGFLKRNYIMSFFSEYQLEAFKILKRTYDPHLQFFPRGFMDVNDES